MTTPPIPRATHSGDAERDWYEVLLDDLRSIYRRADSDTHRSAEARDAAQEATRAAIIQCIYRFEPNLTHPPGRQLRRECEQLADRWLHGTHPHDLEVETSKHFGLPEGAPPWPLTARAVMKELGIDLTLADRYGIDVHQANQVRRRIGTPAVPEPATITTDPDPDPDW